MSAANATARALGVVPQMQLAQADTLCPNAHLIEHDLQADIESLCSLAESSQCFSPIVGIEQIDTQPWAGRSLHQPQSIFLDITGIAPLFGGDIKLAAAVHRWVLEQGYWSSIAIANSVGTAWALSNYSRRSQIATDLAEIERTQNTQSLIPAITITEPNEPIGAATYLLPIEALRLEQSTVTKLHRLGIRKIAQLVELPRAGLASRFNDQLLQRIDQTLHNRCEPILTLHASPELAIEESLEHPTPLRTTIDEIVTEQIHRLTRVLDGIGHGVVRLVCRIEMELNAIPIESDIENQSGQPPVVRIFQIGLYQPSNEPKHLIWLLQGQLDAHYSTSPSHYWARSISIQATLTAPLTWQQSDLFDRHSTMHRDAIAKLVDSLSARMGRGAVVAPSIQRDPQPELAYSWRPLTGWRKDGKTQETKRKLARAPKRNFSEQQGLEPDADELWRRPIRLLHPPKKIDMQQVNKDGGPLRMVYQGSPLAVVRATGPERIDTGWWQGATQQRDYFRIELSTSTWLWVYRDRREKNWFLHGEFD